MTRASDGGAVMVCLLAGGAAAVALAGWAVSTVRHRRGGGGDAGTLSSVTERAVTGIVAALAGVLLLLAPPVGAFAAVLLLNHVLGTGENVPFARYAMFSQPRERSWALRYEDESGRRVNVASIGIMPPLARKRFAGALRDEMASADDPSGAHERAAAVLVRWIDERRPAGGPLASTPIAIVFVEYEFDSGTIAARRRTLTVARPT